MAMIIAAIIYVHVHKAKEQAHIRIFTTHEKWKQRRRIARLGSSNLLCAEGVKCHQI